MTSRILSQVAVDRTAHPTRFRQVFMVEEGTAMDKVMDVTKFQHFILTLIAVGAYINLAFTSATTSGFPDFGEDRRFAVDHPR